MQPHLCLLGDANSPHTRRWALEMRARGWRVHWLGVPGSMEAQLVPPRGYAFEPVEFGGVRGKGAVTLFMLPLRLLKAFAQSIGVIRRVKPDVLVAFGGYITFPGGLMGVALNKPLVLHEQNSIAGMANKVLAHIADRVFTAFPGVLPKALDRTNGRQSPFVATTVVSILAIAMVIVAIAANWDPFLNVFYWFSAVSVVAIVLTEILVSIAVIVYFRRTHENRKVWNTIIAPVLAIAGLALGEFMLISRFNLLAGVSSGGDPAACPGDPGSGCGPFEMSPLGWFLITLPFIIFVVGLILGAVRRDKENYDAVHNFE